jgi:type IV fimbrial biogenesis protein FimT
MCNNSKSVSGFTLLELMVTVSIAGVIMAMAIPSFKDMMRNNRLTGYANELVTSLSLARSEAAKRGIQVTIRRKGATSTQWESGWDVFVDVDGNELFNDNGAAPLCETGEDCLLKSYDGLANGYTLRTGNSTYKDYVAYLPSGLTTVFVGDTFRLCSGSTAEDKAVSRAITLNAIGHSRVSIGTVLSCP